VSKKNKEGKKGDARQDARARGGEAAMAAATWKMMTDSPLTFAGERGVAVVRALECL
jgi:hypothetical protein